MADALALDSAAVLWSAPAAERAGRPLLVLLHGYGSDERDLFGLVQHLPSEFVYAAVRAPLAPPWPAPGYSWYPIEGLDGRDASTITAAAEAVGTWLDTVTVDFVSEGNSRPLVGLLGFSQGAAIALQALRLRPEGYSFALNLSGYAAAGNLPGDEALIASRPPVFWGRGSLDEVIPAPLIAHTTTWLPEHATLSGRVYAGMGHSVSAEELDDIVTFLTKQLEHPTSV